MTIKAVLFDFDGTLVDTLPLSFYAFQTIFSQYDDRAVSREELIAMFGPTEDDIIAINLQAKEKVGDAIADYYEIYKAGHETQVDVPEEMLQLLNYLQSQNIRIGVITGKSRKAFQLSAEALHLSHFFDVVFTGDDVQKPKPDPEGIHAALAILGVSKDEAVFLGDSNADIHAGKTAGLRTYGVQWLSTYQSTHFEREPDFIFTHIAQFRELLENELKLPVKWLDWAKQMQSIAQIGLTYAKDVYDLERYESLRQLSIEVMDTYTFAGVEKINLSFANETGYATPKVDIRGVVFENEKILLVREKADGAWALPGGWADIGYSPSEVAVKEIKEESGFVSVPVKLLAVLDKKFHAHPPEPYHVYKMFILCQITGGQALGGVETSEVQFFGENELPELSTERNTAAQVRSMFTYLRDPDKEIRLD